MKKKYTADDLINEVYDLENVTRKSIKGEVNKVKKNAVREVLLSRLPDDIVRWMYPDGVHARRMDFNELRDVVDRGDIALSRYVPLIRILRDRVGWDDDSRWIIVNTKGRELDLRTDNIYITGEGAVYKDGVMAAVPEQGVFSTLDRVRTARMFDYIALSEAVRGELVKRTNSRNIWDAVGVLTGNLIDEVIEGKGPGRVKAFEKLIELAGLQPGKQDITNAVVDVLRSNAKQGNAVAELLRIIGDNAVAELENIMVTKEDVVDADVVELPPSSDDNSDAVS